MPRVFLFCTVTIRQHCLHGSPLALKLSLFLTVTRGSQDSQRFFKNYARVARRVRRYKFTTGGVYDDIALWDVSETLDYDPLNPYRSKRATYVPPSYNEWYLVSRKIQGKAIEARFRICCFRKKTYFFVLLINRFGLGDCSFSIRF